MWVATYSCQFLPLGNLTLADDNAFLQAGSACHRLSLCFAITASWLDAKSSLL